MRMNRKIPPTHDWLQNNAYCIGYRIGLVLEIWLIVPLSKAKIAKLFLFQENLFSLTEEAAIHKNFTQCLNPCFSHQVVFFWRANVLFCSQSWFGGIFCDLSSCTSDTHSSIIQVWTGKCSLKIPRCVGQMNEPNSIGSNVLHVFIHKKQIFCLQPS